MIEEGEMYVYGDKKTRVTESERKRGWKWARPGGGGILLVYGNNKFNFIIRAIVSFFFVHYIYFHCSFVLGIFLCR